MYDFSKLIDSYSKAGLEISIDDIESADCYRVVIEGKELILPKSVIVETDKEELRDYIINYFTQN